MAKYKGKLKSKTEESNCECEGSSIERELSAYQQHIKNCMRGFSPRGHGRSAEENKRLMMERFTECAKGWSPGSKGI